MFFIEDFCRHSANESALHIGAVADLSTARADIAAAEEICEL